MFVFILESCACWVKRRSGSALANGEFRASWRKPNFTEEEWNAVLDAPSPHFSLLTVADLVPEHLRGAYEDAGGDVF